MAFVAPLRAGCGLASVSRCIAGTHRSRM